MRSGLINRVWLAIAISLLSCAASAQTYPVSGVWVARDDSFPGSTNGACFILKKIGIDAVSSQPFPSLMIFSDNKRFEVRGDFRAEKRSDLYRAQRTDAFESQNHLASAGRFCSNDLFSR